MELRQLRYFVVLAEMKSFSRAAQTLYVTQPTLSQQISVLERELGCTLLKRDKRQVELTESGASLLEEARFLTSRADHLKKRMMEQANPVTPPGIDLMVGILPCCTNSPGVFRALLATSDQLLRDGCVAGTHYRTESFESSKLGAQYNALVCVRNQHSEPKMDGLHCHILERDDLVIAMRNGFTGQTAKAFLKKHPLISVKRAMEDMSPLMQTADALGLPLNVGFVEDMETATLDAGAGTGALILPAKSVGFLFKGIPMEYYYLPEGVENRHFQMECWWQPQYDGIMNAFCGYYDEIYSAQSPDELPEIKPFD